MCLAYVYSLWKNIYGLAFGQRLSVKSPLEYCVLYSMYLSFCHGVYLCGIRNRSVCNNHMILSVNVCYGTLMVIKLSELAKANITMQTSLCMIE